MTFIRIMPRSFGQISTSSQFFFQSRLTRKRLAGSRFAQAEHALRFMSERNCTGPVRTDINFHQPRVPGGEF